MVAANKNPTIFICEPDCGQVHPIIDFSGASHFNVQCIPESSQAIEQIITHTPDLVLLDTRLPVAGGLEVCSAVRPFFSNPILIQGSEVNESDQLLAFESGADDYIALPVSPALLTAKISVHLKRGVKKQIKPKKHQILVGELIIDAARREVHMAGRPIELTTVQFDLLWYLAKRSGRIVSRKALYAALYSTQYNGSDRSIDVYISRIRQQLGDSADHPRYLKTIRGVGYLLAAHDDD